MTSEGYRWQMTAVRQPLERAPFSAQPGDAEVVVDIAGCGVCHTDLGYLYDGVRTNHPLPLTLGHEISGRVVAAGARASAWMGRATTFTVDSRRTSSSRCADCARSTKCAWRMQACRSRTCRSSLMR